MNVCVPGGSGFIGWYLARALRKAGHRVTVLDLVDPPQDLPVDRFVHGDIRNPSVVREALAGCDAMCNLAAAHHDFGISERTYHDVNAGGSEVLCDAMDELGIRRACFYSTVAVYGHARPPLAEPLDPLPASPYGASKLAGEETFRKWTERGEGRTCLVVRPTVTFGPRNFANMYSLIRQIDSGKFVFVGRAGNIKSLSYVENLVAATLFLWERDEPPVYDVFNYVDKPDLSSRQIVECVSEALGRRVPRRRIPFWVALVLAAPFDLVIALTGKNLRISSARVKKLFRDQTKFEADKVREAGFAAPVPLPEGIRRMVRWYDETGRDLPIQWNPPPPEIAE